MLRILVYGAGVIGSWYAVLFSRAGYEVTVLARGKRWKALREKGLLYRQEDKVKRAKVKVIEKLKNDDFYDYILLPVRQTQIREALSELAENLSPTIITMVNSLEEYQNWEKICGKGRILPAFPGAGGGIENDILDAALTPWIIQPTTFGEIGGKKTERQQRWAKILRRADVPYQIVADMRSWQICHLALVVPLAEVYYRAEQPERAYKEWRVMQVAAKQLQANFNKLHQLGVPITPNKLKIIRYLPVAVLSVILSLVYRTKFAEKFMRRHSMKATEEMASLKREWKAWIRQNRK